MADEILRHSLADFPRHVREKLRYADTDRQGHVNNAIFATFCESGRAAFLYDPERPLAPAGTEFVIARLTIDFLDELNWPGEVEIGTGISRLGRSSLGLVQGIWAGERCVARAESVVVMTDQTTRRPRPLPEATRQALESLRVAGGQ